MNDAVEPLVYKKDFWRREHAKFLRPHYRLEKSASLINRIVGSSPCSLLDVRMRPGDPGIIAPAEHRLSRDRHLDGGPAPNLLEADILREPIAFPDKSFDMVVAFGLFEYLEDQQDLKLVEIRKFSQWTGPSSCPT